ncbi:hypothetical protein JR316_0011249 [Psilocybe cubensis]|uniref:Uncharacterized protein n=2 Tax=Psilocybe cubensis TaxID=181762 RepID=A0ACB8GIY5_PSICU|nr:hypothetical protein JR316_0011249 [Psilocybe cubensis]KAH9475690.1 hypothetical protein JR316_0011249 [Psilocybe cubensis]
MSGNTRTLEFEYSDLTKPYQLMLMFEPMAEGKLYTEMFPICWKVLRLSKENSGVAKVVYTSQTGLMVPQTDCGNMICAGNARPCETGQICTLKTDNDGDNYLEQATAGAEGIIQCKVESSFPATVAFGIFNQKKTALEPLFTWKDIPKGDRLSIKVTPVLKIYAVSNYQETEVVKSDVFSDSLFKENILTLPSLSRWTVSVDNNTKAIKITRADK